MMRLLISLELPFTLVTLALHGVAQSTNATCLSEFGWMTNSRGQSPCLMSAYLVSACDEEPTTAHVVALGEGFKYSVPTLSSATTCSCSTVYYASFAACARCQGLIDGMAPWSGWSANCTSTSIGVWPTSIPEGTAIPAWAYLDVVKNDTLNIERAMELAAQHVPDSIGVSSMLQTMSLTAAAASSTVAVASSPPVAPVESSNSSTNTAAIVGGVLGGVILILACIAGTLFVRSRSRAVVVPAPDTPPPSTSDKSWQPKAWRLPLYDPSNPSTFPPEPTI